MLSPLNAYRLPCTYHSIQLQGGTGDRSLREILSIVVCYFLVYIMTDPRYLFFCKEGTFIQVPQGSICRNNVTPPIVIEKVFSKVVPSVTKSIRTKSLKTFDYLLYFYINKNKLLFIKGIYILMTFFK